MDNLSDPTLASKREREPEEITPEHASARVEICERDPTTCVTPSRRERERAW
ncbi:hypothetical protein DB30_05348 [Enhygromyxa salina]|uniref:Uncharacterized protein n=1 Tax=Enhygromyxa salina TaxID=215803 RepID=A0A0C1ZXF6_9BACT|nr:hypothetical protein [Enhygromyxa salina]KIG15778.1 hypothetical protein DB30_05348 [Enhygromyxa salina]